MLAIRQDYFEYTPGILRCLVDPSHAPRLCCRLPTPANGKVVVGEVVALTSKAAQVRLAGAKVETEEIPFDFCVVALGSIYRYALPQIYIPTKQKTRNLLIPAAGARGSHPRPSFGWPTAFVCGRYCA